MTTPRAAAAPAPARRPNRVIEPPVNQKSRASHPQHPVPPRCDSVYLWQFPLR
jgi:hypothetical protein